MMASPMPAIPHDLDCLHSFLGDEGHVFVDEEEEDSVCSSITSWTGWEAKEEGSLAPPHVFLSYADWANDSDPTLQTNHANKQPTKDSLPPPASCPHPFLTYASKGYRALLQNIQSQEERTSSMLLTTDMQVLNLEAHCLDAVRSGMHVPLSAASRTAKALGKAAKACLPKATGKNPMSVYQQVIDRTVQGDCSVLQQTPSCADDLETEVIFLRHALREMLLLNKDEANNNNNNSAYADKVLKEEHQKKDYEQLWTEASRNLDVPQNIEFALREGSFDEEDDGMDIVSLLTPNEGQSLTIYCPTMLDGAQEEQHDQPVTEDCQAIVERRSPVSSRALILDDTGSVLAKWGSSLFAPNAMGDSSKWLEIMQLVQKCKPGRPSRQLLQSEGSDESHSETVHKLRLRLVIMGVSFTGCYNGSILRGVPHGPGVFRFDNRDLYVGEFQNGMMHGEGTLFCRKKICRQNSKLAVLKGRFVKNAFQRPNEKEIDMDLISASAA